MGNLSINVATDPSKHADLDDVLAALAPPRGASDLLISRCRCARLRAQRPSSNVNHFDFAARVLQEIHLPARAGSSVRFGIPETNFLVHVLERCRILEKCRDAEDNPISCSHARLVVPRQRRRIRVI